MKAKFWMGVIPMVILIACNKSSDPAPYPPLIGNWTLVHEETKNCSDTKNNGVIQTTGSLTIIATLFDVQLGEGTKYSVSQQNIIAHYTTGDYSMPFSISGDTLRITYPTFPFSAPPNVCDIYKTYLKKK